jgi:hypothetical protein
VALTAASTASADVHVFGDGETKINLLGPGGKPTLVWAAGATRSEVRTAVRIVTEQQQTLLADWEKIHGRPD